MAKIKYTAITVKEISNDWYDAPSDSKCLELVKKELEEDPSGVIDEFFVGKFIIYAELIEE